MDETTVLLFSYGTLQLKSVQLACFGRELKGQEDSLPGYSCSARPAYDAEFIALTGQSEYQNVDRSANPGDSVQGTVFEVTEAELAAADEYERDANYGRIRVTLRSGIEAWVYVRSEDAEREMRQTAGPQ